MLKYAPPADAALPTLHYRLYAFSSSSSSAPPTTLHLHRQSLYSVGRDASVSDLVIEHPSVSKQHAVLQYRNRGGRVVPYLLDVGSTNGTFLNGERIDSARFYELRAKDVLAFGASGRDYVLLHADSADGEARPSAPRRGEGEVKKEGNKNAPPAAAAVKKRPFWADDEDDDV